jgi:hypothetical protein
MMSIGRVGRSQPGIQNMHVFETFAMPVNIQHITVNYLPSSKVQIRTVVIIGL